MKEVTSKNTMLRLKIIFSSFEFFKNLISDNGTRFKSVDFQDFCKVSGIKHVTSVSYQPQ